MWDAEKRRRLQELRELPQSRSAAEQAEFEALVQELESAEAGYLADATQRVRREREVGEARNRSLEALLARRNALAERLEKALNEARAEQQAINRELASVLAAGSDTQD